MRFDSQEHLDRWKATGEFPAIHDAIFSLMEQRLVGRTGLRVLDLACSTGLLGERIWQRLPGVEYVLGLDSDGDAMCRGANAGITVPTLNQSVRPGSMVSLQAQMMKIHINVVVARRCIPEIFGGQPDLARSFMSILASTDVTDLFIEGRVESARSTHPLKSVNQEISFLDAANHSHLCALWTKSGRCAHMRLV